MILYRAEGDPPDAVICVGQASHAWMSGQMARAWGNEDFAVPEPFADVCLAAEQHDVGMAEWDLRPQRNPQTGLPTTFLEMAPPVHMRLWSAAPEKMLTQSPYAALLISMHGAALYRRRAGMAGVEQFLSGQEALQRRLAGALDEDPERAGRNQRLLWALDYLSLTLLLDEWRPGSVPAPTHSGGSDAKLHVRGSGPAEMEVSPWPFGADVLCVVCDGRRLESRTADQAQLDAALEAAPWVRLRFTLRPG